MFGGIVRSHDNGNPLAPVKKQNIPIMNNCKEFALDDLMAITAIPVADYVLGTKAWQLKPTIVTTSFSPTLTNTIVIGLQTATVGGKLIPIRRHTGKAKDAESDSVAGRLNTVTASCEVERSNGKTSVSFKLYNLMGIQLITA